MIPVRPKLCPAGSVEGGVPDEKSEDSSDQAARVVLECEPEGEKCDDEDKVMET